MSENKITRRNLLKTVIAASGAIAASTMLPSEWVKPIVTSGVLPVHAQSSVKMYVKGIQGSGYEVYAGVSTVYDELISGLNRRTGLAQSGGHAKHANPARGGGMEHAVPNVHVTLYLWSTTNGSPKEKIEPVKTTNENGFTDSWVLGAEDDGKYCHFVISGDEDSFQFSDK